MEVQQTNPKISLLSSMNAFYGIPNTSQETATAIERGVPAPEVYTPKKPEPQQTPDSAQTSPVDDFFSLTSERLEISDQAAALQQQANAPETATSLANRTTSSETEASTPGNNIETRLRVEERSANTGERIDRDMTPSRPLATTNTGPTAATALNAEPSTEPQTSEEDTDNMQKPTVNYSQTSYGPFPGSTPMANSAGQPGNFLNTIG